MLQSTIKKEIYKTDEQLLNLGKTVNIHCIIKKKTELRGSGVTPVSDFKHFFSEKKTLISGWISFCYKVLIGV